MRICIVQGIAAEENSEGGQFCKAWANLMRRNMDLVKGKDTELTFRFSRRGFTGVEASYYAYTRDLADRDTLHAGVQAEKDGFDAVISTCFYDPYLRQIRQAVNIPYVGYSEASMHVAAMMGAKFGMAVVGASAVYDVQELIDRYGLRERAVPIRVIDATPEQIAANVYDAHRGIEVFTKVARELIADGAQVLIDTCCMCSASLRLAPGAEKEYPNGFTEVDGVPILDTLGAVIKMAEMLVELKQAGSPWISRKVYYARPTPQALEEAKMVVEYDGPGFWDC